MNSLGISIKGINDKLRDELMAHPELYHQYYIKRGKIFLKNYGENSDICIAIVPDNIVLQENKIKKVFIKFNDTDLDVRIISDP
jgi:hypothetical protein